jgi:hypothetical protein
MLLTDLPVNVIASAHKTTLVIHLKTEADQKSEVVAILDKCGIPVEDLAQASTSDPQDSISIRIRSDCVTEAVLELEFHGFRGVRCYPDDGSQIRTDRKSE